jgi:hypothetical protein
MVRKELIFNVFVFLRIQHIQHADKKEKKIFLIYKEIQKGGVAKSYMSNGLLIYD